MKKTRPKKEPLVKDRIETALDRLGSRKDREYFSEMLKDLIDNNSIPAELLDFIPLNSGLTGKTRFDQLYDASMYLAFPPYREDTLKRMLGEDPDPELKVWRVVLPEKFQVAHVIIRAASYQDAFALACDYACRVSLRLYRKIPVDLTIRVMFMGEKALRRHLGLRWANRIKKRKQLQLEGREYSMRQVNGARLAAIGHHNNDPRRSIAKYADVRDLVRTREKAGLVRISAVESETVQRKSTVNAKPGDTK
jgi:hypothetical protein